MARNRVCGEHGVYPEPNDGLCPTCPVCRNDLKMSSSRSGLFALLRAPELPECLKPVDLGRWEDHTDYDREFLKTCGIAQ